MHMSRAWLLAGAIMVTAAGPAPLVFSEQTVGGPNSDQTGELYRPVGVGPFPAMVVLHGCDGVGPHYRDWARRLADWGYAALLVDSFRPRGVRTVCNHGLDVPPDLQAADGFAAAEYLRSFADVDGRVGVIGFSHAGWAVLKAVLAGDRPPFAAAVAFYPGCDPPERPLVTDTLILIGEADTWTPAARCRRWRDRVEAAGHRVVLKTYPHALHGFESASRPHFYAGHQVGRDDAAADDALAETRAFLAGRLR